MSDLLHWPHHALPPEPFDSDYAYVPGDVRIRTLFEQGVGRQRRATDLTIDVYQLRWVLTARQYEIFNGFIDTALAGGWFKIDVFVDEDYAKLPARFVQGSFDRRQRSDAMWEVTVQLEVKGVPVMSSDDLDAAIGPDLHGGPYPIWPDALGAEPLNDNFAHDIADGINRDDLPYGDIEQARPFRQRPAIYEWSIPLTNSEYSIFKAWLFWRVYGGDGWFSAPMMRGGSYEMQAVRIVAGTRKDTRSGGDWIVTAQLEVADLAPMTMEDTIEAILVAENGVDIDTIGATFDGLIADYEAAVA